ncbi:Nramp family divalent metal transporter [bacterium]|nr:Nramp family divalent metal transporter [bacterium]
MAERLPRVPKLTQILGPSFILLGLALGSGELIMWPYLTSRWGLGLLWGAVLGITLQFLVNTEIMRYTLCWGESIFVGFWRLWRWWPLWFIFSTFIPWSLPGFSSGTAEIIAQLTGTENTLYLAIFLLLLAGVILTLGKTLYRTMELLQRTMILLGIPFIFILVIIFASKEAVTKLALGLVGKGEGWWFFPQGLVWSSFLAAIAYSGAGGNLNLAQSYYIKEKGFGMGKFTAKITSILRGVAEKTRLTGELFADNPLNRKRFRRWWKLVVEEHLLVFWFLGLLTIILLAFLAYLLVFGNAVSGGLNFLYQEAALIGERIGVGGRVLFLLVAAGMLYSTQIGVLESTSRIISENLLLLRYHREEKVNPSLWFYLSLWLQIFWGIVVLLFGFREPRFLLTLAAVLNAFAMVVYFPLIWYLNQKQLPHFARPSWGRQIFYGLGFLFLLVFSLIVLFSR